MLAGALTGAYAALEFCLWLELVYARRRRVPRPLILHGVAPSIDFSPHDGPYVAGEDLRAGQFVVIRDGKAYAPRDIRRPEPIHVEFTGTVNEEGLRALERLADEATAAMRVVGKAEQPRRFTIEVEDDVRSEIFIGVPLDAITINQPRAVRTHDDEPIDLGHFDCTECDEARRLEGLPPRLEPVDDECICPHPSCPKHPSTRLS